MRKILVCFLACFFVCGLSYAAPCYGPKMPQKKHFFGGVQTYSVFKRLLEKDYGKVRSLQNFVLLSYGVFDWLSLDLKGGAGNIKETPKTGSRMNYSTYLGGGYGFRIRLYNNDKTKMVFGFQHISIHPHTASIDASKHKVVLDDWQFSFLVSRNFSRATPYIGTRWSRMDKITWIDRERNREKSDLNKSVGLVIGTDVSINKKAWFNVEGNFFDATAVAGSLNFAF